MFFSAGSDSRLSPDWLSKCRGIQMGDRIVGDVVAIAAPPAAAAAADADDSNVAVVERLLSSIAPAVNAFVRSSVDLMSFSVDWTSVAAAVAAADDEAHEISDGLR